MEHTSLSCRRPGRALQPLLIAAALGTALLVPVHAQNVTIEQPRRIDIPAGSLIDALEKLGDQSGIQILFETSLADGLKVSGLSGTYSVRAALTQLLADSDLTVDNINEKTVVLKRAKGSSRSATVDGVTNVEEVLVFGTLDASLSVGSKSGGSLRETPKSVTLMTRERMEAQNLTTLMDTVVQTTGVFSNNYTPIENFYFSRGFRLQTMQLDGGAPAIQGAFGAFMTPDTAALERVEVLRGVDGMYSGAGEPGGVINLIRKRAKATPQAQVSLLAGRWNRYRAELDLTGALDEEGRLRGRFITAYEDKEYAYDRADSESTYVFATAEYDLTPTTLLIAGGSYQRRKEDGFFTWGLPRYVGGADLGLGATVALNPEWAHWYVKSFESFARAEQRYGESGVLKLNVTRFDQQTEARLLLNSGAVDPITRTGTAVYASGNDTESSQTLVDLSASGDFTWFGRDHRYTVGIDYAKADGGGEDVYRFPGYIWPNVPAADVFNFNPALYPQPVAERSAHVPVNYQAQNGYYATLGLQLLDDLRLTLGGRYGEFRYRYISRSVQSDGSLGAPYTLRYEDSKFVPSFALSYDFARDWTAYASFGETFKVQSNLLSGPLPGTPLDPVSGEGLELGVKAELFGHVNASVAVFRIERSGEGFVDTDYPMVPGSNGATCCYLSTTDTTSEGLDLELSGSLIRGVQLFSGYTYLSAKHSLNGNAGGAITNQPKHMFKLWGTWQLPQGQGRWSVNGGVIGISKTSASGSSRARLTGVVTPYSYEVDAYSVWNAGVNYQISDAWSIGAYADNLFDEEYYSVLGTANSQNVYGTPRSYSVTVRGRW